MKQTIRIIGGRFRGRKLHFPVTDGLRPTSDRTRETLFNWLMNEIRHARCLDAFAGSGALGFEALSRGASHVVLLERSEKVYSHLLKQAASFKEDDAALSVLNRDAINFLRTSKEQFDIIFLDPPFANNYLPLCLAAIEESDILAEGGLLYIEAPEEIFLNPAYWEPLRLKRAGQVMYGLFCKRQVSGRST